MCLRLIEINPTILINLPVEAWYREVETRLRYSERDFSRDEICYAVFIQMTNPCIELYNQ